MSYVCVSMVAYAHSRRLTQHQHEIIAPLMLTSLVRTQPLRRS